MDRQTSDEQEDSDDYAEDPPPTLGPKVAEEGSRSRVVRVLCDLEQSVDEHMYWDWKNEGKVTVTLVFRQQNNEIRHPWVFSRQKM